MRKVRVNTEGSGLMAVIGGVRQPAPKGYEFEVSKIHSCLAAVVDDLGEAGDKTLVVATPSEKPKRKRRTKAEIEADQNGGKE